MTTIYVRVRHWLFWYGVHGFCAKSCNDEITVYADKDGERHHLLGYFELTTARCLRNLLEHDLDPVDDQAYREEIEAFLQDESMDIAYRYLYPRDEEDASYQVKHRAPLNENGHKPTYIHMWSKRSEAWDEEQISKTAKMLAGEFLQMEIAGVEFIDPPSYEETEASYRRDYEPYVG